MANLIEELKYQTIVYWRLKNSFNAPYELNYFHGYLKVDHREFVKLGANVYPLHEIEWFIDPKNQLAANTVASSQSKSASRHK